MAPFFNPGGNEMRRPVLFGVLEHLLEDDLDLGASDICPGLIRSAGSAIADMFLDLGYQLIGEFQDGRDLVQSYFCQRTGESFELLGLTMVLNTLNDQMPVSLLIRCVGAESDRVPRAGSAVRYRGSWYRLLTPQTTLLDVLELAREVPAPSFPFTLPEAA
ncbi:hypothetical protein [Pseudomonas sp. NCHU5232]|uniref:hypothetical protein n=1 Tax=Pseudomonas sp. NCHU5232 TaxID=3451356 RepID=UPI003F99EFBD